MALPAALRRVAPERLRNSVRLRSVAVGAGVIPPRALHTEAEAGLLADLASGRDVAVEIGVYEGASALVLCRALSRDATLHLVDPYTEDALLFGWRGVEGATRRVVDRAVRARGGPRLCWHVETSESAARGWSGPVDLVFIDGDHTEAGCRLDWELWSGFVTPGGVVVFHDARPAHTEGITDPGRVVDSLFRGADPVPGWRIVREVDSCVAVERTV